MNVSRFAPLAFAWFAAVVSAAPSITTQPLDVTVGIGNNAELTVAASASGTGTLSYAWRRNGVAIAGQTTNKLTVTAARRAEADWYDVVITDSADAATVTSSPARINVAPTTYPAGLRFDSAFAPVLEAGLNFNLINRVAVAPDGSFLVAGDFHSVNGAVRARVARFTSAGAFDSAFNPTAITGGVPVTALAVQPVTVGTVTENKVLVGGGALALDTTRRLLRLNADGSRDTTFDTGTGITGGSVACITIQPFTTAGVTEHRALVGGSFTVFNDLPRNRLIRLKADGTVDPSFYADVNGTVNAITVDSLGRILIGGAFSQVHGQPRNRIARLNTDGSLDATFDATNGTTANNTLGGPDNTVFTIGVCTDGTKKIVIGGQFLNVGTNGAGRLARLSENGTFDALASFGTGFNGNVNDVACLVDGTIMVAGNYSQLNGTGSATVSGVTVQTQRLMRLTSAGAADTAFNAGATAINNNVNALVLNPADNSVLVAGIFDRVNNVAHAPVARFSSAGALDAGVNPTIFASATPQAIAHYPGGKFVVAGVIASVNGTARVNLARFNSDLTPDTTFNTGSGPNGQVSALAVRGDGKILIAGNFNNVNGTATAQRIARLNGDGTLDTTFTPGTGTGPSSQHTVLALQPDGRILVGGASSFTFDGAVRNGLVRLGVDGATDATFAPPALNGTVNAAVAQRDGKIVIGGAFTTVGGAGWTNVARLNSDGTLDTGFALTGSGLNGTVNAIYVQPDDKIVIGGSFIGYNGTTRNRVARLNTDGKLDLSFDVGGFGFNNTIQGLIGQEDGKIIARGFFSQVVGAQNTATVVRLNANGTLDPSFALIGSILPGGNTNGALVLDDGSMVIAGFTFFNFLEVHPSLAHLIPGAARAITQQPVAFQEVNAGGSATFAVTVTGTDPITYQWLKDGAPIAGATSATLTLANVQPADAASYSVQVTNLGQTTVSSGGFLQVDATPTIVLQPANLTAAPNGGAVLSVGILGMPVPTFQWRKNSVAIPGAIGPSLVFANVTPADAGSYDVVVTNARGAVTSAAATLAVGAQPLITAQPASAAVAAGGATTLSVTATGTGTLTYQWRRNGVAVTGATASTLALPSLSATNAGVYDVVVTNASGATTSQPASVLLKSNFLDGAFLAPQFASESAASRLELLSDGSFILGNTATASSTDLLRRSAGVQRYLASGARDAAFDFNFPVDWNTLQAAAPIAGKFYASVGASRYGTSVTNRAVIALFNNDGTVDPSFTPYFYATPNAGSGEVRGMAVQADGKLLAAGFFKDLNGTGRAGIARFLTNGQLDTTFAVTAMTANGGVWSRPVVYALGDANDGKILVGGDFTVFQGANLNGIARLNADGTRDTTFNPSGFSRNAPVRGIVIQSSGKIVLGGRFTVGATAQVPFIRLNADGSLDGTFVFTPMPPAAILNNDGMAFTTIRDLQLLPGDGFVGVSRSVFVRNADGSAVAGTTFTPPTLQNASDSFATPEAFTIRKLAAGGYLVAGVFTHVNGVAQSAVTRVGADGVVAPLAVEPMGSWVSVLSPTRMGNGRVLLSGFTEIVVNSRLGLGELLPDGSVAPSTMFASISGNNFVDFISPLADGRVAMTTEDATGTRFFRRFLADGTPDPTLTTTVLPAGVLTERILVQGDGKTLLWSRNSSNQEIVNGEKLMRLNVDGSVDAAYMPHLDQVAMPTGGTFGQSTYTVPRLGIEVLALDANDRAYVRYTTRLAGASSDVVRLARLLPNGANDTTFAVVTATPTQTSVFTSSPVTDPANPTGPSASVLIANASRREFLEVIPQAGGKLIVCGQFSALTINGTTTSAPSIVRLNADGTLDATPLNGVGPAWSTTVGTAATDFATVEAMAEQPDGKIILAGNFETYNGVAAPGLARLNADGSTDATFVAPVTRNPRSGGWPEIDLQPDGSLLLTNNYIIPGETQGRQIVRLTPYAPVIQQPPADAVALAGASTTFTAKVMASPAATFQWQKNNVDIPGATNPTYTIASMTAADAGAYRVVATNVHGSVTSAAGNLALVSIPTIAAQPANATVTAGGTVTLSVGVTGTPPFTYQWKFGGVDIPNATGPALKLTNVQAAQLGAYTVAVTNTYGAAPISATATLTAAPTSGAFVADPNFARPEFRHATIPGRVTAGASGKLYATFVNGSLLSGAANQRVGAIVRLNADGSFDSSFNTGAFLTSAWPVIEQSDGKVLAGGLASFENDNTGAENFRVWRFTVTGAVDNTFRSPVFNSIPRYMTLQSDGKVLVAVGLGTNAQNGGLTANLVRLNSDGSRDTTFAAPTFTPASGGVFAPILVDAVGKIVIGGPFNGVNGTPRAGVARLNADGSLDGSFVPSGYTFGGQQIRGLGFQTQGTNAGKILVAGGTLTVSGTARPVIRLNPNGTLDSTFTLQTVSAVVGATGVRPRLLNVLADDSFTTVSGTVTKFAADGALATGFTPPALSAESFWMETLADGSVVISPDFGSTVNGAAATSLVRFTATGSVDTTFLPPAFNFESYPSDAAILPNGKVLAWGRFDTVGATARAGIARFNLDGTLDGSFVPAGGTNFYGVASAAPAPDGSVLLATLNGASPTSLGGGLVRLTNTGAVDAGFTADTAIVSAAQGGGFGMLAQPDGRTIVWSQNAQRVVDGGVFMRRVNASGSLDTTFTGPATNYGAVFRDTAGSITSITAGEFRVLGLYPDGRMIAVAPKGPFAANPTAMTYTLVRLTAAGAVDAAFNAPTLSSGVSTGFVTVTDPVKAVTQQFPLAQADTQIAGAQPLADGSVLVYGAFTSLGGTAAPGIARLTDTGALDTAFNVGAGAELRGQPGRNALIGAVTIAADGKYWISGSFDTFGGRAAPGLTRLNANGTVDTGFATTLAFQPYLGGLHKILLRSTNEALVVGSFARNGDAFPFGLNRLVVPGAATITTQPVAAQILPAGSTVTLRLALGGAPLPGVQWRKNGVPIAGADTPTLTLANVGAADIAGYDAVLTTAAGAQFVSKPSVLTVAAAGGDAFPNFAWRNPLPSGGTLRSGVFAGGKYVAVGQGGRILTSTNGSAWTVAATLATPSLSAIAYCAPLNLFVVVGQSDIYTASGTDLATWTKHASNTTDSLNGVAVGLSGTANVLVAVGNNGRIVTSGDGVTWTAQQIAGAPSFNAVAGAADLFAAVGFNGALYTSVNGTAWTQATPPTAIATTSFTNVRFLNNQFVAVGNGGAMLTWPGTGSWTQVTTNSFLNLRDIALAGTTYVATADTGKLLKGASLAGWTQVDLPTFAAHHGIVSDGTGFVTLGSGGEIWSSSDATTWTPRGTTGGFWRIAAVEYLNGKFVAVGSLGAIYTSADGDAWTRTGPSSGPWLDSVGFGAGVYVAPTDFGDILTSSDATTWTTRSVGDTVDNNGVAHDGTRFVVVGANGKVRISTDAVTWTNVSAGITTTLRSVAARPGVFVAVGDSGKIYSSPDGATWTDRSLAGTTARLWRVRLIDGTFYAVGDNRTVLASNDGLAWVPLPLTPTTASYSYRDLQRLGDGYYIACEAGTLVKTADLRTVTTFGNVAAGETLNGLAVGNGRAVVVAEGGALLESAVPASPAPTIVTDIAAVTTDATKNVVLNVFASAAGPITYQWFKDNVALAGATSSTLVLANAATSASGAYRVTATSGGATVSSSTVTVTVNALAAPQIQLLPIVAQATTGNATFTVTATGTAPLTYQWYRGLSGDTTNPVGSNSATFATTSNLASSERYWVKVTNFAGQSLNSPTTTALALAPRNGPLAPNAVTGIASNAVAGTFTSTTTHVAVAGPAILVSKPTTTGWQRVTGLTGSTLRYVAYGNARFVAVGDGGAIRTSNDLGATWQSYTVGANALNGVCFDGARFVAAGANGTILTSTDGATWTTETPLTGAPLLRAIRFISGLGYVAVGDGGALFTSSGAYGTTAPTWTARTSNATTQLNAIAGTSTKVVVVGRSGTIRVSTDGGVTWNTSTSSTTSDLNGIDYDGNRYVVAANGPLITSTDAVIWTTPAAVTSANNASTNAVFCPPGTSLFLVGGFPGVIFSGLGGLPAAMDFEVGLTTTGTNDTLFADGVFYLAGNAGQLLRTETSSAPLTAVMRGSASTPSAWRRLAVGKTTLVVVGDSGWVGSSPDGLAWATRQVGTGNLTAAAYGAGKFVIGGIGGAYWTSTDGNLWTAGAGAIGTANLNAMAFGNGLFVAVNTAGGIFTSPDGAAWTARSSGVTTNLANLTFAGGKFVVVGNGSTVLTSPDGIAWTPRPLPVAGINLTGVAYGDGMYVATQNTSGTTNNGQTLFASADAVTWNATTANGGVLNQFNTTTVAYGNGSFLFGVASAQVGQTLPAADAVRILTQPGTQTIANGATATLNVVAGGASPTYQWYEGVSGDTALPVNGATSASYTTPALVQSKRFWVRVTSGGATADSATAQLLGAPAIAAAPTSRAVTDGTPVTFQVFAYGAGTLSYAWKFNGSAISGATNATLAFSPATIANAGTYQVTVSNAQGSVSSATFSLSVTPVGPTLGPIASTYGRNIPVGANTELSVGVQFGTTPLSYQWQFNGAAITGATKSTYFITNAKTTHSGTYTVTVSNAQGAATATNFVFSVAPELGWRWRNPLPNGNIPSSVRFIEDSNVPGQGTFYVGATRSTLLTSTDAVTWTQRAVPGTGNIFSQAYAADLGGIAGNKLYVALGGLNAIFTSRDGAVWTPRDSKITDTSQLNDIAYGNGRFVAAGFSGHTTTSTDGITWTAGQIPTPVASDVAAYVRFVNGVFYVGTHNFDSGEPNPGVRYWTSTDGLTWASAGFVVPAGEFVGDIAFGNNVWVGFSARDFMTSTDGVTWTKQVFGLPDGGFNRLRFVNGRFVAVASSGRTAVSTDGINWTSGTAPVTAKANLNDVAFGAGVYVVTGSGTNGSVPDAILTSTDAINWTQTITGEAQATALNGIAAGNGKYVAVGNSGALLVSPDGLAWSTASTNGYASNFLDVAYGNGVFAAVGQGGRIMVAAETDLTTWTTKSAGTSVTLRNVKYGNGRFFAVGDGGISVKSSVDGQTWTANPAISNTPQLFGTAYGTANGVGVQVATGNGSGIYSSSDDGASWVVRSGGLAVTSGYSDVIFAGNRFVVVGLGGIAATSTDGINWVQVPAFTSEDLGGLAYLGGHYIAPGTGSTYYVSPDAVNWQPRYSGAFDRIRDFAVSGTTILSAGGNGAIMAAGLPLILASPPSLTARAGSNVTLVSLVGASAIPVSYQWMKDGSPVTGANVAGATTPTLTVNGITSAQGGSYTLVATNALGNVSSTPAAVDVILAPTFTTQPQSIAVTAGQGATFTAGAAGTPPPTYQWKKNGADIANGTVSGTTYAGATTSTLTLTNVQPAAGDVYTVVATNSLGAETSLPATLTVNVLPAAGTPPANQVVTAGGSATFSVVATGTPAPTLQWRVNGFNVSGATSSSLTLTNVALASSGSAVTVAMTNAAGTVVSPAATLTVNPIAPVIVSPLAVTGLVNSGFSYLIGINATTATFSATGLPAGLSINTSSGVISGTPTATTATPASVSITASNITGSDTKTLAITINPPPPVITSALTASGQVGQALSYTVTATNSPTSYTATTLPAGLTRTGNVISGSPSAAGSTVVTVTAANASGAASRDVTFTIAPAANAPAYGGAVPPSGTQNAAFTFTPTFTNPVNATNGYAITSGALPAGLTLNANTGVISGTPTATGTFAFTLTATGTGGSTSVNLSITINPPATAPVITSASTASATVNVPFTFTVTTDVAASNFAASNLPAGLAINSAGVISGTPTAPGTYNAQVSATNGSGTGPASILVITVNPSASAPVISSAPVVQGRVGVVLNYQLDASNGPESYAVTSGPALSTFGLAIANANNNAGANFGLVTGTPTAAGTYKVWFAATNTAGGAGPSLEITFTILPALNVPVITTNGTVNGQVGQQLNLAITATNAPTSFGATGLPAWLTRTDSLISGIPPTATTTAIEIVVTATNTDGTSAPKTVAITIAPAPATPVITSALAISGQVAQALSYTITASDTPTSFSAAGLPPGLTLNPTTGVISGTPTQAGPFSITLNAANAAGVGNSSTLAIAIAPAPQAPAITSAASVTGKVGVAFTYTIVATNGPITSYAVSGTLPLGLALNTSTGAIAGNPAAPGVAQVSLTATSANGTSQPQPLIIVINPADNVPVITSALFAVATVGTNFSYTITATNMPDSTPFAPPITLDAVGLPPGLAVNPATGVIQGQPTAAGTFNAALVGVNAAGNGPIRALTIFVQPAATAPVVTSSPTAAGQVGVAFSYQIAATNSPLAFEALGAPLWMTINGQSGALGGTPPAPGTFTAQLKASNSAGASNPAAITLYIAPAANTPVITSSRAASGQNGQPFSYTLTASNTPTSFVATGLPAGLSLAATTGAITGTPTISGVFNITVSANNANGAGQPAVVEITIAAATPITIR